MKLYRICSSAYPPFDGTGSFLNGGRWNSPGRWVIYCGENLSCCRLEMLVHIGDMRQRPRNHASVEIAVPQELWERAESLTDLLSGWDHPVDLTKAQALGDEWYDSGRSLFLRVPSVASSGDWVVAINQRHPDIGLLQVSTPKRLVWDRRLFKK
jgi:RES domain-containing protein